MKKTVSTVVVFTLYTAAQVVNAEYAIGTPLNLGPTVNSSVHDDTPSISSDGLELYFMSYRLRGQPDGDLYVSTRITTQDPWSVSVNLGPTVNTSAYDVHPCISSDGLELYFVSTRPGASDRGYIWVTKRETRSDDWGPPVPLGRFFSGEVYESSPAISSDGLELYISDGGSDQSDLWIISRSSVSDPWGQPMNLGPTVNSPAQEGCPSISSDGRTLFFYSERSGGFGGRDIWVTRRASPDDDWGAPVNLGPEVNTPGYEIGPSISADGRTLYFQSGLNRGLGNQEIWQVSIDPVIDFNGDYQVNIQDLLILIEYWGQNEPSVEIGPPPLGDEVIDAADLEVLMHYWGRNFDPTCLAHWRLDESQSSVAQDSAFSGADGKKQNATLIGNPIWRPQGGRSKGALEFDGVDDHLATDFVIDPSKGPMSVFTWIKGGAPGQSIISQGMTQPMFGSTWLGTDPLDGRLVTAHMYPIVPALESDVVITDDQWHWVALVWDGTLRHLFVDGVEVTSDQEKAGHMTSNLGLHIGADSHLTDGSFWTGLIDDVRIYDRVVEP